MRDEIIKLMQSFPYTLYRGDGTFFIKCNSKHRVTDFTVLESDSNLIIKCKVLEWCSRAATKFYDYINMAQNNKVSKMMLDGINKFLDTNFSEEDMELIYTKLGNAIRRNLTMQFVLSNYNMEVLK